MTYFQYDYGRDLLWQKPIKEPNVNFFPLKILNSREDSESGVHLELRKFFCFPSIIDSTVTSLNEDTLKKR